MITYKSIIQYFEGITSSHQQIKSFTYGEISLFDEDKFTLYPALHLTPTATSIADQTITYGFEVAIFDRYDGESNKMENEAISLSDSLLILQDLCKELTEGKYFINEDTLINLQLPISATPFVDTKPDICSGWSTSFSIETPNETTACNIPYYLTEIWKNKNITLPSGVPNGYTWYSMMNMGSLSNFASDELTDLYPIVDKYNANEPITRVGRFITYDYTKNAIHIKTLVSANDCYLSNLSNTLSGTSFTFFLKIKDFGGAGGVVSRYNNLISFSKASSRITLAVNPNDKLLYFTNPYQTKVSDFPVAPISSSALYLKQLRRKEPLVIALVFDLISQRMECWYDNDKPISINPSGISLDGFDFKIGSEGAVNSCSDFYLCEFFYSLKALKQPEIKATREWLNYR